MTYYIKDRDGKIYKGKSVDGKYYQGMIPYGCKLYNPYNKTTIIGWNNYKNSMINSQKKRFG